MSKLEAVAEFAVEWWASKRPVRWTVEQHLGNPRINTATSAEKRLAEAVAEWVFSQRSEAE